MKTGVYLCECGSNIAEKINLDKVKKATQSISNVDYVVRIGLMCSPAGKAEFTTHLKENCPDRVVIAACSPRDHESTFRKILSDAGLNPYMMQMINIREQIAWVTADIEQATIKTITLLKGAISRVRFHEALTKQQLETHNDVLIIGAGPAGLKAALSLAEAGRKVTLVEKTPMIGGMPVRYEELFPSMECGPCMLEPLLDDILHGPHASNIEVITQATVETVKGFFGNFEVTVHQAPRYVSIEGCIGCGECVTPCPVSTPNEVNYGLSQRKAIDFTFFGSLPNATFIDPTICLKLNGKECNACVAACPIDGVIQFDQKEQRFERTVGAVIIAVGANLYDVSQLPQLGYGKINNIYTSFEFERISASSGPTQGSIQKADGTIPKSIAIIHCVGSLDSKHKPYCSKVCCQSALKFNHMIHHKLHDTKIIHLYKEMVLGGKEATTLFESAHHDHAEFIRYSDINTLNITSVGDHLKITGKDVSGHSVSIQADMVILEPALVANNDAKELTRLLDVATDKQGFFEELHGRASAFQSKIKGVYLAGTCQDPKDITASMTQGMAATGHILASLIPGKKLEIEPIVARVDEDRCSGCKICISVCPYKAISYQPDNKKSYVNSVICQGCGTCVAACPAAAMIGNHFTNQQIMAEIEGVLS